MDNKVRRYLAEKRYKELEGYLESSIYYEGINNNKYLELLGILKYKNKKFEEAKSIFNKINSERRKELFNENSLYYNYKELLNCLKKDDKKYYEYINNLISIGEKDLIKLKRKLYIKDKKYINALLCK